MFITSLFFYFQGIFRAALFPALYPPLERRGEENPAPDPTDPSLEEPNPWMNTKESKFKRRKSIMIKIKFNLM